MGRCQIRMAKTCKVESCDWPVWGLGYCKNHQYLRPHAPPKPRTVIRKVSLKRQKKLVEYSSIKEEMIAEARLKGGPTCFLCNEKIKGFVDIHHLQGRKEENLINKEWLVMAHRNHHNNVHDLTVEQLERTSWYAGFLGRLKQFYPSLYEREIEKKTKTALGFIRKDTT